MVEIIAYAILVYLFLFGVIGLSAIIAPKLYPKHFLKFEKDWWKKW